jgi:AcrR family transcriptional regulator
MPKVTDEHRDRRRRQILDAAMACFDRHGLHATTTDEIVAEAGLSAGAIYRYFDSKDAIIEAIAAERHAHERSMLADALVGDDPRASLRSFLDRYFDWLGDPEEQRRRRVNVYVWAEALHNSRLAGVVASGLAPLDQSVKAVRAAVRSGAFPPGLDAEAFVRVLLALLQGFVLQQCWDPMVDLEGYRSMVLEILDATLAAADGSSG